MNKITIIGDVHGKLEHYKQIIDKCDFSICVGDFEKYFKRKVLGAYRTNEDIENNG